MSKVDSFSCSFSLSRTEPHGLPFSCLVMCWEMGD